MCNELCLIDGGGCLQRGLFWLPMMMMMMDEKCFDLSLSGWLVGWLGDLLVE